MPLFERSLCMQEPSPFAAGCPFGWTRGQLTVTIVYYAIFTPTRLAQLRVIDRYIFILIFRASKIIQRPTFYDRLQSMTIRGDHNKWTIVFFEICYKCDKKYRVRILRRFQFKMRSYFVFVHLRKSWKLH